MDSSDYLLFPFSLSLEAEQPEIGEEIGEG